MERQANGNRSSLKPVGGHGLLQLGPASGRVWLAVSKFVTLKPSREMGMGEGSWLEMPRSGGKFSSAQTLKR